MAALTSWSRRVSAGVLIGSMAVATTASSASTSKRHFTILAVEPKGGTTVEKEAFPTTPLPSGGGYVISPPDEKSRRWEISTYVWQPAQIVVTQGDEVTLEFVGINGADHPTTISGLDKSFTLKRGHAHRVTFIADKVGAFGVICSTHQPSMRGELVVLPRQ